MMPSALYLTTNNHCYENDGAFFVRLLELACNNSARHIRRMSYNDMLITLFLVPVKSDYADV